MGMYIPNMKSEQFYDLCKEHGLEIIAVPVPPHGDLIDKDATMNAILEERGEDTACWFACIVNDMPVIIPSDKAEEGET